MLQYFTKLLFESNFIMTLYSPNVVSLIHSIRIYSRPFDEILYTYDSKTTNNETVCLGSSTTTKDTFI
ncbi:unnamed protein product [Rotaria sp. Silwood1]|nr:unnamed protein product [Rotaria sp. Silwood1]